MSRIFYILSLSLLFSCNPFSSQNTDYSSRLLSFIANEPVATAPTTIYSIKGKLQGPDGTPVASGSMNVSVLNTSLRILPQVIDNGTTTVTAKTPGKLSFVDIDPGTGTLAGPITIYKATDESAIDYYNLYWSDASNARLKRIAKLNKSGSNYIYVFPLGTEPPQGASYFLAVSGNSAGEASSGASVRIKDTMAKFATDETGSYTMKLTPGGFNVAILSASGEEMGEMELELPTTYNAGDPVPTPTITSGDFNVTITGFGSGDAPVTEIPLNASKEITAFTFSGYSTTGIITNNTITVSIPTGSDVTALKAVFTMTGKKVLVGTTEQVSGTTTNDFSNPVAYKVIAEDGSSQTYTVSILFNNAPSVSSVAVSAPTTFVGNTLSGSYVYSDPDSHTEGLSTQQWYRCTDNSNIANCSAISGANATSYMLQPADANLYFRYAVTPVDSYGLAGSSVYSSATAQVVNDSTAPVVGGSGIINISNVTSTSLTLNWTAASDTGGTAQSSLVYYVYQSTIPELYKVTSMQNAYRATLVGSYTNSTSVNITGLTSNVPVYFNIYVRDLSGNTVAYNMVREVPATGLVAHFKLDSFSGYQTDQTGSYNSGSVNGVTSEADRANASGKAPHFNNTTSDYIQVSPMVPINSTFTYAAWIYLDSIPTNPDAHNILGWNNGTQHAEFRMIDTGKLQYTEHNGITGLSVESASTLSTAQWIHVAATRSGGTVTLYINGLADGSGTVNHSLSVNQLMIGARGDNQYNMHGRIDELRIYNRVLSATELKYLASDVENNMISYYPLDGNGTDFSANSFNLENGGAVSETNRFSATNRAMKFNGSEYMYTPSYISSHAPTVVSVSTWVNTAWASISCGSYKGIVSKMENGGYRLGCIGSSTMLFYVNTGSLGKLEYGVSGLSAGWHQLIGTYDTSKIKLYIDGALVKTIAKTGDINYTETNNLFIGADPTASGTSPFSGSEFPGIIDDVRIYNRALNAADAFTLYEMEK